jgi:glycine oxidase
MAARSDSFDVIVVGGGVIGLAAGWRLAGRGARVAVLERGSLGGGTTHVAAGMLAPVAEAERSEEPLLRLGIASAVAYPAFVEELRQASGLDPGLLQCGTMIVARDRDEAEWLDRVRDLRSRLGLSVERLLPGAARRLEPALAPTLRLALDDHDDHAIDPRLLVAALGEAARRGGASLRTGVTVDSVVTTDGVVSGVRLADGTVLDAEHVVIAAGVWSGQIGGLPDDARVPVRPVKGQILRLRDPAGPGLLGRVLRMRSSYVVPRGDGRYVLGATMEERGFDTTVTAGAVFELLRDAIELLPGLDQLVLEECSAGLRPGTPDNAPAIGPGALPGLHWATGHHRGGVLLAPVTAELIASSILDGAACPEEFSPLRFAGVGAVG